MNKNQQNVSMPKQPIKRAGCVNEFLWLCAGVDRKVLRQCPADYAKYAGIGGTILCTAIMAMFSGGYALNFVFNNLAVAICFGIFWGILIFNLDRFIVNTMYSDGKVTISWQEIKSGLPRIILAIFLGIVISYPLELKIFDDEISVKIEDLKRDKLDALVSKDQVRLDSLEKVISTIQDEPAKLFAGSIVGGNAQLNAMMERKNDAQANADGETAKINQLTACRNSLRQNNKNGRNDGQIASLQNQITQHVRNRNKYNTEIRDLTGQMSALSPQIQDYISKQEAEKSKTLHSKQKQAEELRTKIANAQESYKNVLDKNFRGFQAQMHAFSELKMDKDEGELMSATQVASILIMLLFITIETIPTFFRMMMEDGPYDNMLMASSRRTELLAQTAIQETDTEVKTDLQISTMKNDARLKAELDANDQIIAIVAEAQADLMKHAVEIWKQRELEKIDADPEAYISSNETRAQTPKPTPPPLPAKNIDLAKHDNDVD